MPIREVLVLHHTHTDFGYTHPPPVARELHRRAIDEAIELCERTGDLDPPSRVRWTCEVTWTTLDWLRRATERQVERFGALAAADRISVAAALCNMTPLYDAAELVRSLEPIRELRERLGTPVRLAIQHDVNGVAWPLVGLLRDCGVEALLMGINTHFGCHPLARPSVFRWAGPDGRALSVLNAEHYHSFDRWLEPHLGDTARMRAGLERYLATLPEGYPHDFIVLSATHFDFVDNNPPSPAMAEGVRRWNEEGREPVIRFVTGDELAGRLVAAGEDAPVHAGDWPDAWNFGCGATARETRISRLAKRRLVSAEAIDALSHRRAAGFAGEARRAWEALQLHDEHTWGSWAATWNRDADDVWVQQVHKARFACEARWRAGYLVREALEAYRDHPARARGAAGVVVFNPTPLERTELLRLPAALLDGRWEHHAARVHALEVAPAGLQEGEERVVGPVALAPHSVTTLPLAELVAAPPAASLERSGSISSPFYRLEYDPASGCVTGLVDRELDRDLLDGSSQWDPFGWVEERVDPERHRGAEKYAMRDAFFETDFHRLAVEKRSGWKADWPALRRGSGPPDRFEVERDAAGVRLRHFWREVPGAKDLCIEIELCEHRDAVAVDVRFRKSEVVGAEGIYLALPLALRHWRAHHDAASQCVELDREQLPGTMRDFLTVGSWIALHDEELCVTLSMRDVPLVQPGGFWFGQCLQSVPRDRCLLLPWLMNNYWDTNFPASQPGVQRFRLELTASNRFDIGEAFRFASHATPLEVHPLLAGSRAASRAWIEIDNREVLLVSLRRASEGDRARLLWLSNPTAEEQPARIELPELPIERAWRCSPLGESLTEAEVDDGALRIRLPPRTLRGYRLRVGDP